MPFAAEYGLTDRLELLVEPVAWTAIRPKIGARATGVGDLEATATWLARAETPRLPAFALAGEVKFPTAHNNLIGTGKTDIAGYLIASKRWSRLDAHANVSYTVVGARQAPISRMSSASRWARSGAGISPTSCSEKSWPTPPPRPPRSPRRAPWRSLRRRLAERSASPPGSPTSSCPASADSSG